MGSSHGSFACSLENGLQAKRYPKCVQLPDDALSAFDAFRAKERQMLTQNGIVVIDKISQDVDVGAVQACAELHTRNHFHSDFLRSLLRLIDRADMVMVGDPEGCHSRPPRPLNKFAGGEGSIRCGRVSVQINAATHAPSAGRSKE
jgi:hypothetical protein